MTNFRGGAVNFEEALIAELKTVSGLSGKIFPLHPPKGEPAPLAFFLGGGGEEFKAHDGYTGLVKTNYEINTVAKSYASMAYLGSMVNDKLKSFQSRAIGDGSVYIQNISVDEPDKVYEEQVNLYRSSTQIIVTYRRN